MQRIKRRGDEFELVLYENEVSLLRDLTGQLDGILGAGAPDDRGTDPVRERLFPRAYLDPTEDVAEEDWQHAVHDDLVRAKAENLATVVGTLDGLHMSRGKAKVSLSGEQLDEWVGALNDVRLALGIALGVSEDQETAPEQANAAAFEVYHWLTHLQGALIDALVGGAEF
ncbi:MAG TPA: DUF2017 family protein [Acidimicrobiia bacterium]